MRQLRWGLKAEFPYTKVFTLGVFLTVLGSACIVISVVGIVKLAWGYYVSTGMWGGAVITISGLAAMYSARSLSSASARLYFLFSVATCVISFAMLVLSAGGLTYKSDFYRPVRFESERHTVTLFLHGSVLGISVLSLACNLLSVIVCCKFMTREKERPESFKLRSRHRRRCSDSSGRSGSLRSGSGRTRSSTNSRTPLFHSDGTRKKHIRQNSGSDSSTTLKIPTERHRRDSERSRGSSRSRHSHHHHSRQPSSVSQNSRVSGAGETEVTTTLLRDPVQLNTLSRHQDSMSSHAHREAVRDSLADTVTDSVSEHIVFDPDEEPPPPYEERRPTGDSIHSTGTGDETDTETVVGSSSVVVPSYLPLNIPVTCIGGDVQMESLQRHPPPATSRSSSQQGRDSGTRSLSQQGRDGSAISNPSMGSELLDNCVSLMRMALTDDREEDEEEEEEEDECRPLSEERSHSPEICALTGARLTPVASIQPDTVGSNTAALVACVQPSPGSSETTIPNEVGQLLAGQVVMSNRSQSMPVQSLTTTSPSALPTGVRSPNSAFRPVGKGMMPASSVPLHNFFSPISAPGSPHHTVYSPVASATNNPRLASNPTSPRHTSSLVSSSDSLRGGTTQSSLWKKIPLPASHNQSNKTSSVPTKEVVCKNIPGPAEPVLRDNDRNNDVFSHPLARQGSKENTDSHLLPRRNSKEKDLKSLEINARTQFASLPARPTSPKREASFPFATFPVRNPKETAPAVASLDRHHASRRSGEGKLGSRHKTGPPGKPLPQGNPPNTHDESFKQSAAAASADVRNIPAPADPVCRSAGIQATDDGGISSSMDRTHRWVLGTLPTGTRYQGVTRNIAHAHLTSQGPRAATLGAAHSGRLPGSWNHPGPQVESSTLPTRSHVSVMESSTLPARSHVPVRTYEPVERSSKTAAPQRDSSFPSPKKSAGPLVPKAVKPNPAESTGNGSSAFSSPAKSQPVAPKPLRPGAGDSSSPFSSPAKSQPLAPKAIKPTAVGSVVGDGAFSSPAKAQPLAPKAIKPTGTMNDGGDAGTFSSPAKPQPQVPSLASDWNTPGAFSSPSKPQLPVPASLGNGTGAFSSLVKSQSQPAKPLNISNGSGAFSSPSKSQPLAPKAVKPSGGEKTGAFSSLGKSQPLAPKPINLGEESSGGAFSSPGKSQPIAPKPVKLGEGVGSGAFSSPKSQPLAGKTVNIGTVAGNGGGAYSSPAKAQPLAPKAVKASEGNGVIQAPSSQLFPSKPVSIGNVLGNGPGAFSSPAKPQPIVPKAVKLGENSGAFSSPSKPQPFAPKPVLPASIGVSGGAFLMPVTSHPLAPKSNETLGSGSGAFSSLAKQTQPASVELRGKLSSSSLEAFSAFSSLTAVTEAPKPSKPVPAERSSNVTAAPAAPATLSNATEAQAASSIKPIPVGASPFAAPQGAALSPSSRLPRFQSQRLEQSQVSQPQQQVTLQQSQPQQPQGLQPQPQVQPQGQQQPSLHQPQPQQPQPQVRQVPAIPPRAPPQPQPVQRQRHHLPPAQNQNQQPDKPLFSVLL